MDLKQMTPASPQKVNSGYLEYMLEIIDQFDKALEMHACKGDERTRVSKLRSELVDVKHETERLFDQVCDREVTEERRDAVLRVEAQLDTIDMVAFTNGLLRGPAGARQ